MNPIFNHFDEELLNQAVNISLVPESIDGILSNITEYVKQIELENHPELTKPCLDTTLTSINIILYILHGGERSCYLLSKDYSVTIYSYNYTDLITRIENEHALLEESKQECVKRSTPFEVQSCLINFLYTYYISHLEDLNEEVNYQNKGWTLQLNLIQSKIIDPCFKILRTDITNYEEQTIADTKICLWAIPKPSSQ